mmetsp:Transcript_2017/g.3087  ORF Transcript_2017/g.3087 Transcript_2017/m.3087 type:complete len:468 (+) Transcript_2017:2-1405(+)
MIAEDARKTKSRRFVDMGMGGGGMILEVLSHEECEALIAAVEEHGFENFNVGKNLHSALEIACDSSWTKTLESRLASFCEGRISRRLRFYRYRGSGERFAAHIDSAWPLLADDDDDYSWQGRFSILIYLNSDFDGGETVFYESIHDSPKEARILTAIKPISGAILLIPQAADHETDYAQIHWPMHEGSPLSSSSRGKYIIRTDLCLPKIHNDHNDHEHLRRALVDQPAVPDTHFLQAVKKETLSPFMGTEAAAPWLYTTIRFLRLRRIAEVGAGYTSLWILQALKDNDQEIRALERAFSHTSEPRLLDWPWFVSGVPRSDPKSFLLCIDDCLHQEATTTANKVENLAHHLRLDSYLTFNYGDAFDMYFEPNSLDFFWLDFGVSDRLSCFLYDVILPAIRPGGFVAIHSTCTNQATRTWLDNELRFNSSDTGFHHISLLEPHKRFQNSITLLQKRTPDYSEPIFSLKP